MIGEKKEKQPSFRRPMVIICISLALGILVGQWVENVFILKEHPTAGLIPVIGCFYFIHMGKPGIGVQKKLIAVCMAAFLIGFIIVIVTTRLYESTYEYTDECMENSVDEYVGNRRENYEAGEVDEYVSGRVIWIELREERVNLTIKPKGNFIHGNILVSVYDTGKREEDIFSLMGEKLNIKCVSEMPREAGNPGNFDYRKYLYGKGISRVASATWSQVYFDNRILESNLFEAENEREKFDVYGKILKLVGWLLKLRSDFIKDVFVNSNQGAMASGILFGSKDSISDEVLSDFMDGGAGHVLAVSGLHIGIIYSIVGFNKTMATIVLLIYGTASSWSPSVTRAVLMILLRNLSEVTDRRYDDLSALSFISFVMLMLRPYLLFSSGFQMSFVAMLGICFFRPGIKFFIEDRLKGLKGIENKEMEGIYTMLSVQLLLIPYSIYSYNRISVVSLLANHLMITLAGLYVPLGGTVFLIYFLLNIGGSQFGEIIKASFLRPLGSLLGFLSDRMVDINEVLLLNGKSSFMIASPKPFIIIAFCIVGCYLASEDYKVLHKRNKGKSYIKAGSVLAVSLVLGFFITFNPVSISHQVFIDVGQGDAFHLHYGSTDILIDGGGSRYYDVGNNYLRPYLLNRGIGNVDLAITTHQHMDHYLGIEELNENYPIDRIVTTGKAGDKITIDEDRYIEILWPIPQYANSDDENYYSRVFKVWNRGVTTLITGDITEEGEKALIEYYRGTDTLNCHILKIAHHGSRFSSSVEFLDAVSPVIAVISVGRNNYGHPSFSTIEKLREKGIIIYRTDLDGAVGIIVGKTGFWVCGNKRNMRIERYSLT